MALEFGCGSGSKDNVTKPDLTFRSLDPLPRLYPAGVTLVKRSSNGITTAPVSATLSDIEDWLLHGAFREEDMASFLESLCWRFVVAGFHVDRVFLNISTLHPQLVGFAWIWNKADGLCDEVRVSNSAEESDSYLKSPLFPVFEFGETIRRNPTTDAALAEFPLMAELAQAGITDYLAFPLSGAETRHAISLATKHPSGFDNSDLVALRRLLDLFALHVERYSSAQISNNTLNAYLGSNAASKVLAGSIRRGAGEPIQAIIWVSDLRNFTGMSDHIAGRDMLEVLNAYFEAMVQAVQSNNGQVLKFIGDGLLAVFPFIDDEQAKTSARLALAAAREAFQSFDQLNASPPAMLEKIDGWRPLRAGIALHEGDVFFGNIGGSARLDFTVVGPAVNEASRVEGLQKTLNRRILITGAVAPYLDCKLDYLGDHQLRGVSKSVSVYSPTNCQN